MSTAESPIIPRKIWTRQEVDRLSWDGLSLELVNGDLIDKAMGKKPPHIYWKTILGNWLRERFGYDHVRYEDPIDVATGDNPTNEPEPDLTVTYQSIQVMRGANPKPEDLRLVVEISHSTYSFDRKIKAALYARAGIREYWVVDVRNANEPTLIVHLGPSGDRYQQTSTYKHDENAIVLGELNLCLQDLVVQVENG